MPNKLVDLEVNEISLVFDGAVGETFTIIKSDNLDQIEKSIKQVDGKWYVYSEDGSKKLGGPYKTKKEAMKRLMQIEYFKEVNENNIVEALKNLDDDTFISIMKDMISKYNEINEGGQNQMDELKKMLEDFIETTNKNMSAVNKSIDEIQELVSKFKEEINEVKNEKVSKNDDVVEKMSSFDDKIENITKSLEDIKKQSELIKKNEESIKKLEETIEKLNELKLNEVVKSFEDRIKNLEDQANDPNSLDDDQSNVEKSKDVFWKSIVGYK